MPIEDSIVIEKVGTLPIEQQRMEIVERKGIGHPDTICDSMMNQAAVELFNAYIKTFGESHFPHFNLDKAFLAAGDAEHRFGGGFMKKPMLFVMGDRATTKVGDVFVPVGDIILNAGKRWLKQNLRYITDEHIEFQDEIKQGSAALTDIFRRPGSILGANDTSAAVGYAPLTKTELAVIELEQFINSTAFHNQFPAAGEDVKVMAIRRGNDISLTVGIAFVDMHVASESEYFKLKEEMKDAIREKLQSDMDFDKFDLNINTLDVRGRGENGVYLSIAGTSADCADSGQVGRGNKPSGVISMLRGGGAEAAAGKNPTSHVGKIYNLLAQKMARRLHEEVPYIVEANVHLVSQIGRPINDPLVANPKVVLETGVDLRMVRRQMREIIIEEFADIKSFCRDIAEGKVSVC